VEDAVADYVEQGIPHPAAYRRAVAGLGDPHAVARRFNDVYRGWRSYMTAMLVCLLLAVQALIFHLITTALDITEYSTASRIGYVINHSVSIFLSIYVVIALRRLLVWRYNNPTVDRPIKVVIGGSLIYLAGNLPLELTVDTWDPVPTLSSAANSAEGAAILLMHGGMFVLYVGLAWLGGRAFSTRNGLVKSAAVLGGILGADMAVALTLLYLDSPLSYIFGELSIVLSLLLMPIISLVFFQAIYTPHRLPAQTA